MNNIIIIIIGYLHLNKYQWVKSIYSYKIYKSIYSIYSHSFKSLYYSLSYIELAIFANEN